MKFRLTWVVVLIGSLCLTQSVLAEKKVDLVGIWLVKELSQALDGAKYEYNQEIEFINKSSVKTLGASYEYTFDGTEIVISSPIPATYKIIKTDGKKSVWEVYAGSKRTGYFFLEKQ
jgi:O6-methylguanine-DNA--protein-cysteine methyltransferase